MALMASKTAVYQILGSQQYFIVILHQLVSKKS